MKKIIIGIVLLAIIGIIIYMAFLNDSINKNTLSSTNLEDDVKTLNEEIKRKEEDDNMK